MPAAAAPSPQASGHRATADEDGVQFRQRRRGSWIAECLGQLDRDQRRVPRPGTQCLDRRGQFSDVETRVDGDGHGARQQAAHHHLQPGDVMGRQCEQPAAGTADPVVGGRRAGDQGGRSEHGALGDSRRARRRNHDGDVVVDVLADAQRRRQQFGGPDVRGHRQNR
jgi:hypothetical protein